MNRRQLISEIAKQSGLPRKDVVKLLNVFSQAIADKLAKGEKIAISGFGTFALSKRKGRMGINPQNPQQKIPIPPSVTAHFRPSKKLKDQIK